MSSPTLGDDDDDGQRSLTQWTILNGFTIRAPRSHAHYCRHCFCVGTHCCCTGCVIYRVCRRSRPSPKPLLVIIISSRPALLANFAGPRCSWRVRCALQRLMGRGRFASRRLAMSGRNCRTRNGGRSIVELYVCLSYTSKSSSTTSYVMMLSLVVQLTRVLCKIVLIKVGRRRMSC